MPSAEGTTPWLPEGFSQVTGTSLETGLTIANTLDGTPGTQNYVWIEVPTTEQTITLYDGTTRTIHLAEAKNDEEIYETLSLYANNSDESGIYDYWSDGCGLTYDEYQK